MKLSFRRQVIRLRILSRNRREIARNMTLKGLFRIDFELFVRRHSKCKFVLCTIA